MCYFRNIHIVLLFVTLLTFHVRANTETINGYTWTYRINGDTVEIYNRSSKCAISPAPTGKVCIPQFLGGKPVTKIGDSCFISCTGLTDVEIPDSVTTIGIHSFEGCTNLDSILIHANIEAIGSYAFSNCTGLKILTLSEGISSIHNESFANCSKLRSVLIPNSVSFIGDGAFYGCSNLESVNIPDGVKNIGINAFGSCSESLYDKTSIPGIRLVDGWIVGFDETLTGNLRISNVRGIGDGAFHDCIGLSSIEYPSNIANIGSHIFEGCSGITSVTIPDGVASIENYMFSGCSGLTDLQIPDSVTNIGEGAFRNCNSLKSITISDSVKRLGAYAFSGCSGLTDLHIPNSVTNIGYRTFYGCSGLRSVSVTQDICDDGLSYVFESSCGSITNVIVQEGVINIGERTFRNCSGVTSITIADSVTNIAAWAFEDCRNLQNVAIGAGLSIIPGSAFGGCSQLDNFTVAVDNPFYSTIEGSLFTKEGEVLVRAVRQMATIPSGVTEIGSYAFYGFTNLTIMTIPNSVASIGVGAFSGCSSLTDVTIPDSVTNIGGGAFSGCSSLTDVTIPDSVISIGDHVFARCSGLKYVTIPGSVTSIGYSAFWGCTCLTNVTIFGAVMSIGDYTFSGCSELTIVTIPDSVTSIGVSVFDGCSRLMRVTIPDSVKDIGYCAFKGCSSLANVTIPDSVTSIEYSTFSGCTALMNVTIGHAVTNIKESAFSGCSGLENVWIPGNVTSIGDKAFYGCAGLKSATISDGVKRIGTYAFSGCSALMEVTIPDSLAIMEYGTFQDCRSLTSITIPNSVTNIGYDVLSGCANLESITIPFVGGFREGTGSDAILGRIFGHSAYDGGERVWQYYKGSENLSSGTFTFHFMPLALHDVTVTDAPELRHGAFYGCGRLTQVTLPAILTNIEEYVFYGCSNLESIVVANENPYYKSESGLLLTKDGQTLVCVPPGLVDVVIPDGVVNIGDGAFESCTKLKSVQIPEGVTAIGRRAFYGCNSLMSITIPDTVVDIGEEAFRECKSLIDVWIRGSVANVGDYAFAWSDNLRSVIILGVVDNIGTGAFYGRNEDLKIYLPQGEDDTAERFRSFTSQITFYKSAQTVAFDANGGSVSPVKADVIFLEPYGVLPIPSRPNHFFLGWTYEDQFIDEASIVSAVDDHTLVARWIEVQPFTFVFDANGGDGSTNIIENCGAALVPPTVGRAGYTFKCWVPEVHAIAPASNVTYTAQWQVNQYNISFDANGGTGGTSILHDYGSAIAPPSVTRTGYTFAGWSPAVAETVPDHDVAYVAQWKINQYTLTFDFGDGSPERVLTQDYGTEVIAPTVSRVGHAFLRWLPDIPSTMPANDMSFTAQWGVNQYKITFDANGGDGGLSTLLDYGSRIVPPAVTREWCVLVGWTPEPSTVPAEDATFTAQWKFYGDSISADKLRGCTMKDLYPEDYSTMTEIVLEEGVRALPEGFFDGCEALERLTLPSTLEEFGYDDLPSRIKESLSFDDDGFMIYQGWLLRRDGDELVELVVPEDVAGIGRGAFQEEYSLLKVTLPLSLRSISQQAFLGCVSLNELNANSGLRHIGDSAFEDCISLPSLILVDGVESIGSAAFRNNALLDSVRLPVGISYIGVNAFKDCPSIRGITVPTQIAPLYALFPESYDIIEDVIVAEGETSVIDYMFAHCESVRSVELPESVTNVGARAFLGCGALSDFVMPDGVLSMGAGAFSQCAALQGITLSSSLTNLPDEVFLGCSRLASLMVPESVSYVGRSFFSGKSVHYQGNAPEHHENAYPSGLVDLQSFAVRGSKGWYARYPGAAILPPDGLWCGYPISYEVPPVFDVTFVANGGSFANGEKEFPVSNQTGNKYVFPAAPERPGWIFKCWRRTADGGAQITPGKTCVTATSAHRVYAEWQSLDARVTVSFNANGGTAVEPREYVPGMTYGDFPVPTRAGYRFNGWWTATGIEMTESTKVSDAVMTLTAHWIPVTYIIRFLSNDTEGMGTMTNRVCTYDVRQLLPPNGFARPGFAFSGWSLTPAGGVKYADGAEVANLAQRQGTVVDLYAVWVGAGYSVRFDAMGGEGRMEPQTIGIGETRALLSNAFAKPGFRFVGWDDDERGTNVVYRDGENVRGLSQIKGATVPLYAVWAREEMTARILFNANGGVVSPSYWECAIGSSVESFPMPTRPGYKFDGWFTSVIGGEQVMAINTVVKSETYYARWVEVEHVEPGPDICTITFNANGGSIGTNVVTVSVMAGSVAGYLPDAARMSYKFAGWFTAADKGTKVVPDTEVTSSVTYYAHWEEERPTTFIVPASVTGSVDLEIEADWAQKYAMFTAKFGTDMDSALQHTTEKYDAAGRPMYVWQDYVMGTDPTDTNDVFKATITIDGDDVNVSWSPELPAAEAAKRVYTVYGKAELSDAEWIPIPDGADKSAYRFFKVGVEMR